MFDWLRRRGAAPAGTPAAGKQEKAAQRQPRDGGPATLPPSAPLPEVVGEGNTQADWNAWEDSMTALDSQLQDLVPSQRVYVRDTRPSQLDELDDPFSSVRGPRR